MAPQENAIFRNIGRIEVRSNLDNRENRTSVRRFDSVPQIVSGNERQMREMIDIWRYSPVLENFGGLHNKSSQYLSLNPLTQYQNGGVWNHTEKTVKQLSETLGGRGTFSLLIEDFAKKGNIKAVTNLLFHFQEIGREIPKQIALEALCWAELVQARQLMDKEDEMKESDRVRIYNLNKSEMEEAKLKQDPYYHLYMAYLLIGEFEKLRV